MTRGRRALLLTVIAASGRALGLLFTVLVAWRFGRGPEADAWFFATAVPVFALVLFSNAAATSYAPLLARSIAAGERDFAPLALRRLILHLSALVAIIAVVGPLGARLWSGLPLGGSELAGRLVALLLPALFVQGCNRLLRQTLELHDRFSVPSLAGAIRGGVALISLPLLVPSLGVMALPWCWLAGEIAESVALLMLLRETGLRFRPGRPSRTIQVRLQRLSFRLGPVALGEAAVAGNIVVDRLFAARLPAGSLAALAYADRVRVVPETLLGLGLLAMAFARWSRLAAAGDRPALERSLSRHLGLVTMLATPAVLALWLARQPLVSILYDLDAVDTQAISEVLGAYLVGVPPLLVAILLARALAVVGRPRALLLQGLLSASANVVGNALLAPRFGAVGLAWSTTLVNLVMVVVLGGLLRRTGVRPTTRVGRRVGLGWAAAVGVGVLFASSATSGDWPAIGAAGAALLLSGAVLLSGTVLLPGRAGGSRSAEPDSEPEPPDRRPPSES